MILISLDSSQFILSNDIKIIFFWAFIVLPILWAFSLFADVIFSRSRRVLELDSKGIKDNLSSESKLSINKFNAFFKFGYYQNPYFKIYQKGKINQFYLIN